MRESLSGHVVPWVVGRVDLDPISFCQGSQTWMLLCVLLPCRLGGMNILLFVIVFGLGFALGLFVFSSRSGSLFCVVVVVFLKLFITTNRRFLLV